MLFIGFVLVEEHVFSRQSLMLPEIKFFGRKHITFESYFSYDRYFHQNNSYLYHVSLDQSDWRWLNGVNSAYLSSKMWNYANSTCIPAQIFILAQFLAHAKHSELVSFLPDPMDNHPTFTWTEWQLVLISLPHLNAIPYKELHFCFHHG